MFAFFPHKIHILFGLNQFLHFFSCIKADLSVEFISRDLLASLKLVFFLLGCSFGVFGENSLRCNDQAL